MAIEAAKRALFGFFYAYEVSTAKEESMNPEQERIMADENHVQHMFLSVVNNEVACVLNIAGHPYRLRELIFMMIENGCSVAQTDSDEFNTFEYDQETVEAHDYLTSIIKARFL